MDAFAELAAEYDATFSETALGQTLRGRVWEWLDERVEKGQRVLDLGCGTGEDARHLLARGARVHGVEPSEAMLSVARAKNAAAGDAAWSCAAAGELDRVLEESATFDGVLANFGVLNCVDDLPAVLEDLAARLEPGGWMLACVMGRVVPWEWAWMLGHLRLGAAFRRLRPGGVPWRGMRVRYPSVRAFRRACPPQLRVERLRGVGVFLPPTYAEPWLARRPRTFARLSKWEQRWGDGALGVRLADHYLVDLSRTG